MASNFIIALIVGAGAAYLVYSRFLKSSGGNAKNAAIASAVIGVLVTIIGTILLDIFLKKLKY